MKPSFLMLILILGLQMTMNAQKSPSNQVAPKEDIRVNREFDENGNLVKFDSIYSYSWSGDTLLVDSIHPGNFAFPFGNNFGFFSDSSFFAHPFFEDFDQHFFDPMNKQQDSILNQLRGHHKFHFRNDSLDLNVFNMEDLFKLFSDNLDDTSSINSPFKNQFDFSPNSMDQMMKMLEKQMKDMEEHHQKYFNK